MIKLSAFLSGILLFAIHAIPAVVHAVDTDSPLIIDVLMGEPVEMETMLDDLADVKIIYLGEVHTIARHHKLQTDILNRLKGRGLKLALGMEMFSNSAPGRPRPLAIR